MLVARTTVHVVFPTVCYRRVWWCYGSMIATCPQCGAEIGGTRHRILDGNVPNPRMDGTGSCSIYGLLCFRIR